jgi:2-amino-4-hydroxy-6-hydroxymethyldihydropteridine diphosphokinase
MALEVTAYIGLGANLGDARLCVLKAMDAIADIDGVALRRQSSLYGSAPVDSSGPDYFNAVVEVVTRLRSDVLLTHLQALENAAGRERPYPNAPRTLDLDLLLFGDETIDEPRLTVPHPRMWERAFVLLPLAQIAPHRVSKCQMERVAGQGIWRL